jgi:WD40 repeat protein
MKRRLPALRAVLLASCLLGLAACSPRVPVTTGTEIQPTGSQAIPARAAPGTPTPVPTKAPTDTAVPTLTSVPTPTPTIWPVQPIAADNAGSLRELDHWGRGSVMQIQKLAHKPGESLVLTPHGLFWYGSSAPFLLNFLPDVDDFVLSADERWLAVGTSNGEVQVWDTDSLSLQQSISHAFPEVIVDAIKNQIILPYYVGGMAFSPDGSQLAIGYADGKIETWRLGEEAPYATLQHEALSFWMTDVGLLFHLSFSPDSRILTAFKSAPYINANRLTFWSLPEAKLLSVSDAGRYYHIPQDAYLPDGKTVLVLARDDSYLRIQLWDIQAGKRVSDFATGLSRIVSTALAPGGDQVTVVGSDTLGNNYHQVWSLPDGKQIENEELDPLPQDEELIRFRKFLVEQGHYANAWESEEGAGQARLIHEQAMPVRVLEGDYVLSLPEERIEPAESPEGVTNTYYDPQGNFIAWCEPGTLTIRDHSGGTTSTPLPFESNCEGLVVSPQKHYAAVWVGHALYIQDLTTGKSSKPVFDRRWRSDPMLTARFSEDEQILLTSMTALVTLWQVEPLQRLADSNHAIEYIGNNIKIELSKDKTTAVTLSVSRGSTNDRTSQLLVWRVADVFPLHRINLPLSGESQPMFTCFALSPDGSLIASGDDFGGLRLWSVASGEQLASYDSGQLPLDLAFTPDGAGLVVVLGDGTTRLLGMP